MTTRIAIFSDMHGNSAATEAVLAVMAAAIRTADGLPDHVAAEIETGGAH